MPAPLRVSIADPAGAEVVGGGGRGQGIIASDPSLPSPLPSAPCQGCVTPIVVAPGQPVGAQVDLPGPMRHRRLGQKRSQVIEGTGTGMVAPAPLPQKGSLSSLGLARFIPARDIGAIRAERRTQRTSLLGSCPPILDAWRSCAYDHSRTPATPTTRRKLPDVSEILEWNHQRIDRLLLPERPPSGRPTPRDTSPGGCAWRPHTADRVSDRLPPAGHQHGHVVVLPEPPRTWRLVRRAADTGPAALPRAGHGRV